MQMFPSGMFQTRRVRGGVRYIFRYEMRCPDCGYPMALHQYCRHKLTPDLDAFIPKYVCKSDGCCHYCRITPSCFPAFTSYSLYYIEAVLEHPNIADERLYRKYRAWFMRLADSLHIVPAQNASLPKRVLLEEYISAAKRNCHHSGKGWLASLVNMNFDKIRPYLEPKKQD